MMQEGTAIDGVNAAAAGLMSLFSTMTTRSRGKKRKLQVSDEGTVASSQSESAETTVSRRSKRRRTGTGSGHLKPSYLYSPCS